MGSSDNSPHQRHMPARQITMDLPNLNGDFSSADVSFNVDSSFNTSVQSHYQTPNDRDGDYSYAYDSSVSPAFIIKYSETTEDEDKEDECEEVEEAGKYPKGKRMFSFKERHKGDANVENIYEEIRDTKSPCKNSQSISNDDDGSSRKSSSVNSDSGIGGFGNKPSKTTRNKSKFSQGTLDIVNSKGKRDRKTKTSGSQKLNDNAATKGNTSSSSSGATSALDNLLFQTAPGMTPNQRRNLRKSLVDEVFEELVQRHHDRVLQQLRLDMEDFIAPNASDNLGGINTTPQSNNSKTSVRSSSTSSPMARLKKCESMDFKDAVSISSASSSSFRRIGKAEKNYFKKNSSSRPSQEKVQSTTSREGFRLPFLSSARKCGEVINRKYFTRTSRSKSSPKQNQQETKENNGSVRLREKTRVKTKSRPLSALFLSSSFSKSSNFVSDDPNANDETGTEDQFEYHKKSVSHDENLSTNRSSDDKKIELSRSKSTGYKLARRNSDFDCTENEDGVPSKRLQRSKIIASFLEQLNDNNDNEEIDDDFGDDSDIDKKECINNNNNDVKQDKT